MGAIDKAIASSVTVIPRPMVKRISARYIAGERLEDAVATIRELNREGCAATVDFYLRRGAVVSDLSPDEMREICEMREALELLALRKALPNMADEDLRRAKEVLDLADKEPDDSYSPGGVK